MSERFIVIVSVILIVFSTGYAEDGQLPDHNEGIEMIVPEGQFISEPIEIFINRNINDAMNPKLKLLIIRSFSSSKQKKKWEHEFKPMVIAGNQTKIVRNIAYKGTKMLFALNRDTFSFYDQVKPVLFWEESAQNYQAVGNSMNIANDIPFVLSVIAMIAFCVTVIALWSKYKKNSLLDLLIGDEGYLSLSQTQVAAWTIVVGGIVFGFGMLMLKVPEIPQSLLVLMGLSLATGGIKYYAGSKGKPKDIKPRYCLSDLICESDPDTNMIKTSLPKAQMLFWTVLMLFLFVVKSIADGILWAVPWEMVALMGMSQSAYLSVHLPGIRKKESDNPPDSADNTGEQK